MSKDLNAIENDEYMGEHNPELKKYVEEYVPKLLVVGSLSTEEYNNLMKLTKTVTEDVSEGVIEGNQKDKEQTRYFLYRHFKETSNVSLGLTIAGILMIILSIALIYACIYLKTSLKLDIKTKQGKITYGTLIGIILSFFLIGATLTIIYMSITLNLGGIMMMDEEDFVE